MTGKQWEAAIAAENQALHNAGRAMLTGVPTHSYGGHPWRGAKVDFTGCILGGQHVSLEAKCNSGTLKRKQRLLLAHVSQLGGIALVYRWVKGERHLCEVDAKGTMARKSDATLVLDGETWLDAWHRFHTETECF